MKKGFRIALATAAVAAGMAMTAPSSAQAQVAFSGSFPGPHGRISVGFGDPYFPVGAFVPSHYRVIRHAQYGRGFFYRSRWIPVRSYRSRWVVCESPDYYDGYSSGSYDGYDSGAYYGYDNGPYYQPYVYSYRPHVYSRPYGYRSWGHGGRHHGWGGWHH